MAIGFHQITSGRGQILPLNLPGNLFLECFPVPKVSGCNPPHVILEYALANRGVFIALVWPLLLCLLTRCSESSIIDGLKYCTVEMFSLSTVKGVPHQDESISQSLHPNSNGPVAKVGFPGLQRVQGVGLVNNESGCGLTSGTG